MQSTTKGSELSANDKTKTENSVYITMSRGFYITFHM